MKIWKTTILGAACVGLCTVTLMADTLKLKDGTSLKGRVIDQGEKYWVKGDDGASHMIDKEKVQDWVHGDSDAATPPAAGNPPANGGSSASKGSNSFSAVKKKADGCEAAVEAVGLWQTYIDSNPAAADLTAAKKELAVWQKMVDGDAEKINGKWFYGKELEELKDKVKKLEQEASEAMTGNQMLQGLKKYQEAVKLYPNNFEGQFFVGYIMLVQGAESAKSHSPKLDDAVRALEKATQLRPDSAAAFSDLAIAYNFTRRWQLAIDTAYHAVKIEDTKGTVQNLFNTIYSAPPSMRNGSKVKEIMEEIGLLAGKHGINGKGDWEWVRPHEGGDPERSHDDGEKEAKGPAGIAGTGSGEFISADGYILTNRHVAKEGDYLLVRQSDGTMRPAKRIIIDDEQDMAVIKINPGKSKVPYIHLAKYDHPAVGSEVSVFGYPLVGLVAGLNSSVKMTHGIVTAWDVDQAMCDVTVDAAVNPGNSGGCMVDKCGNLMALTTAKTFAGNIGHNAAISSYGEGQSTGRLRKFFKKQTDKLKGLKLEEADPAAPALNTEDLAAKLTPITVSILICNGTPPDGDGPVAKPPAH